MRRAALVLTALALIASACGEGDQDARRVRASPVSTATPEPSPTPAETDQPAPSPTPVAVTPDPATPAPGGLAAVRVSATRIATLQQPLAMAVVSGDPALYVAEKTGRIRAIRGGEVDPTPVLDVSDQVSSGSEQGLLGLAFAPDGRTLYVHFTDRDGTTRVRAYAFRDGRADTENTREVLSASQPHANHNGGHILIGPDGMLWVGLGDGGGSGDPQDNGQDLGTLLGKMLRIDPRPDGDRGYRIPADNPFVGRSGARDEIWAYGLRNPWRYSFDRSTRDLWIADVGQNRWEWVNHQQAGSGGGENYGWARMEGSHRFSGEPPGNHVPPVYEYANDADNCAIVGGHVYRGQRIGELRGAYVFADFCGGRPRAFVLRDGRAEDHRFLGPRIPQLSSFGEDHEGELYMLSLQGGVFRLDRED